MARLSGATLGSQPVVDRLKSGSNALAEGEAVNQWHPVREDRSMLPRIEHTLGHAADTNSCSPPGTRSHRVPAELVHVNRRTVRR